jgi:hypothetical protein
MSSGRRFNLLRRPLLVLFQGGNFHQRALDVGPMHGFGVVGECFLCAPFGTTAKLKESRTKKRMFEDVAKDAEQAAVLVVD